MEAISQNVKTVQPTISISKSNKVAKANSKTSVWDRLFNNELEHYRFGIISAVLVIVGCMGGLTVGMGAISSAFQLALIVFPTMLTLSLLLAVAPVKYILNAATLSTVINIALMIYNLVVPASMSMI